MSSPAIIRLRRKLDIIRLDLKAQQRDSRLLHDIQECIALLDIIEREVGDA